MANKNMVLTDRELHNEDNQVYWKYVALEVPDEVRGMWCENEEGG